MFEHASSFFFHDNTPPLQVIQAALHYGNGQQIAFVTTSGNALIPLTEMLVIPVQPAAEELMHFHLSLLLLKMYMKANGL